MSDLQCKKLYLETLNEKEKYNFKWTNSFSGSWRNLSEKPKIG